MIYHTTVEAAAADGWLRPYVGNTPKDGEVRIYGQGGRPRRIRRCYVRPPAQPVPVTVVSTCTKHDAVEFYEQAEADGRFSELSGRVFTVPFVLRGSDNDIDVRKAKVHHAGAEAIADHLTSVRSSATVRPCTFESGHAQLSSSFNSIRNAAPNPPSPWPNWSRRTIIVPVLTRSARLFYPSDLHMPWSFGMVCAKDTISSAVARLSADLKACASIRL